MEQSRPESSEEFGEACQLTTQVIGELIGHVTHGVVLDRIVDPNGGGIEEIERSISCLQLLAKLPPREVGRFIARAEEATPAAAAARYRIRLRIKKYCEKVLGIRKLSEVL